jgi:hypothetical protein
MKKQVTPQSNHKKLVWGLVIGAAVGVAIGGLFLYAKNNDISILDEIDEATRKAKKKVSKAISEGLEELEDVSEKIGKSAKEVLKKTQD